eukprot:scaffold143329_cov66-Phaeocystis_antarctica.AAC.2
MIFDGKRVTGTRPAFHRDIHKLRVWRKKLRDSKAVRILPSSIFVPPCACVALHLHLPHIVLDAHLVREACVGAAGVRMCVALQYCVDAVTARPAARARAALVPSLSSVLVRVVTVRIIIAKLVVTRSLLDPCVLGAHQRVGIMKLVQKSWESRRVRLTFGRTWECLGSRTSVCTARRPRAPALAAWRALAASVQPPPARTRNTAYLGLLQAEVVRAEAPELVL